MTSVGASPFSYAAVMTLCAAVVVPSVVLVPFDPASAAAAVPVNCRAPLPHVQVSHYVALTHPPTCGSAPRTSPPRPLAVKVVSVDGVVGVVVGGFVASVRGVDAGEASRGGVVEAGSHQCEATAGVREVPCSSRTPDPIGSSPERRTVRVEETVKLHPGVQG